MSPSAAKLTFNNSLENCLLSDLRNMTLQPYSFARNNLFKIRSKSRKQKAGILTCKEDIFRNLPSASVSVLIRLLYFCFRQLKEMIIYFLRQYIKTKLGDVWP